MNHFLKVFLVLAILNNCDKVTGKKYIKILTFEKEPEHGIILHHIRPISIIKETITPFGKFSFKHSIEKRDLHKRKARDIEDVINVPDVETEEELKKKLHESILTDIILARVEFYKGKAIKSETIEAPSDTVVEEIKIGEITPIPISEVASELEGDKLQDKIPEPVPLAVPEEAEILPNNNEQADIHTEEKSFVGENSAVEEISEGKPEEVGGELVSEDVKLNEENQEKEELTHLEPEVAIEKETIESKSEIEPVQSGVIENREIDADGLKLQNIDENVALVSPDNVETTIVEVSSERPVEITPLPVSPLPQPVYIPLYTEIKTPVPIPAVVNIPSQPPVVVTEEVSVVPPVVVITEKAGEVPPPPPPPPAPVDTVTTVVETTETPSLFRRGSRFMLNISSRLLKKMLRLVTIARTRLHLGNPVEE